ncbi:hypothetical protein B0H13DRAFT_1962184 [Mycena leptocephala]|nr:hypothetical protein B0H13DRAFT_1962184 [Mycena leptocephala]
MSYPFVLSQRCISQKRDMFLFCLQQYPVALMSGGWNLARHHISIETFYRWLDIIDDHYRDRNVNFQLRRINLTRLNVLRYIVDTADGPFLPRDSTELLSPGVYDGQPYSGRVGNLFHRTTFQERERQALLECPGMPSQDPSINVHNEMPQVIIDAAIQRDGGVCCVTGRADLPVSIIWVFPPSLAYESYQQRDSNKEGLHELYRTVENAITLCTELTGPFTENMFSVDFEDNNRIVTFVDLPQEADPSGPPLRLATHLPRLSASKMFWHLHFKWSLRVHFLGGDVSLEVQDPDPNDLMDELVEDRADLNDPKWHSGVGGEVWEEFLGQTLAAKQAMYDSEDDEDAEQAMSASEDDED